MEPELDLDHGERGDLAQMAGTNGYRVLNRIMRSMTDQLIMAVVNAPAGNDAEVIGKHKVAKGAAQFYDGVVSRVNNEIELYGSAVTRNVPIDVTAGLLDLGDVPEEDEWK